MIDLGPTRAGWTLASHDWAATPLGPPAGWPQSLRTVAELVLASEYPMLLAWGREHALVYNEAFGWLIGAPRSDALGHSLATAWPQLSPRIAALAERVFAGERVGGEALAIPAPEGGPSRSAWVSCSPVRDDSGAVAGALIVLAAPVAEPSDGVTGREPSLQVSEHRFREFGENSSDVPWIVDAQTKAVSYLSPAFEWIWGESRAAVLADPARWSQLLHPDDRARASAAMPRVLAGKPFVVEYRIIRPDGEVRWIRDAGFPITEDGVVRRSGGIAQDVTELKRAEAALRASEERQASLLALSDALRPLADTGDMTAAATRLLAEHLGASRAYYVDWFRAAGFGEVCRDYAAPGLASLAGRYPNAQFRSTYDRISQGRTWVVEDLAAAADISDTERREYDALGVRAWVNVPLVKAGALVSALCVVAERPRAWTAEDIALVELAAERLWAAIERGRVETALRESEARLQSLMTGIPQLVWRAVGEGTWTWASPQWTAFTGQAESDSHGFGWLAAVHPDDRETTRESWEGATARGHFEAEHRLHHAGEDRYRWVQSRATPVRDADGAIVEWLGTSTDVDELHRLQDMQATLLAELQHRVRNILGMVQAMVRQSADSHADDLQDYMGHLIGRLDAMGRTQVLLTRAAHAHVDLEGLVRDELEAHAAEERLLALTGPRVELSAKAAEALTLAIHELATNSVKYGALSQDCRLAIAWRRYERAGTGWLELTWQESGCAPVAADRKVGFGTELIERRVPYELRGEASIDMADGEVLVRIAFPLTDGTSIFETGPVGNGQ